MFILPLATLGLGSEALAETLPIIANATPVLSVSCDQNLEFGTIMITDVVAESTLTILPVASQAGSDVGRGFIMGGPRFPARCQISGVGEGSVVQIEVRGEAGAAGTFTNGTLTGAALGYGRSQVPVELTLSQTTIVGQSTAGETEVLIGGTVRIGPGLVERGTFTGTFTFVVSE